MKKVKLCVRHSTQGRIQAVFKGRGKGEGWSCMGLPWVCRVNNACPKNVPQLF